MENNRLTKNWQADLLQNPDILKNVVASVLQNILNTEFDNFIGAEKYERSATRVGVRNGYYQRQLNTRVGSITLEVCRDREGKFSTNLFEQYERSEKALVLTMAEMYFSGVSTRKVAGIVDALCGINISKSQVSELSKTIDSELHTWRNRLLKEAYAYLIFDARYEKIRENGHVVSKAFVVAIGITADGFREIIGSYIINSESEQGWDSCMQSLKERGLHGVKYVVADNNKGLKLALEKHFQGVLLQRCQVHFMRNFLSKISRSNREEGVRLLQDVFAASTHEDAVERAKKLSSFLVGKKQTAVAEWIDENIEEALVVYQLPAIHYKQMKSTNMLERLNQELKRRSRCVRTFTNEDSCMRLLGTLCMDMSEGWSSRRYLSM